MPAYTQPVAPTPTTRRDLEREIMRLHYALNEALAERDRLRKLLTEGRNRVAGLLLHGIDGKNITAEATNKWLHDANAALEGE